VIFILVLITGVPGVGKTTIAKELAKVLKYKYCSEKSLLEKTMYDNFLYQGSVVKDVDIKKFEAKAKKKVKHGNFVLDGILFPEINVKYDVCIILYADEKVLRKRMKLRKYCDVKIEDNIFVQQSDYFSGRLENNAKQLVILQRKGIGTDLKIIENWLKKRRK